jgi:hypothetical protein
MARAGTADVDVDVSSLLTDIATWRAAGGDPDLFFRWLSSRLANLDPQLGAVIHRRVGSSNLNGFPATLLAADVKP